MICFTDGACGGNGSAAARGGFGVIILDDDENYLGCYHNGCVGTTNNREELKAILWVLLTYGKTEQPIVYSDSAYAVNTLTQWCWGWRNKGWLKSDNKEPENLDLIQTWCEYWDKGYRIDLRKCRGHAGEHWNEQADKLAVAAKEGAAAVVIDFLKKGYNNG